MEFPWVWRVDHFYWPKQYFLHTIVWNWAARMVLLGDFSYWTQNEFRVLGYQTIDPWDWVVCVGLCIGSHWSVIQLWDCLWSVDYQVCEDGDIVLKFCPPPTTGTREVPLPSLQVLHCMSGQAHLIWGLLRLLLCYANWLFQSMSSHFQLTATLCSLGMGLSHADGRNGHSLHKWNYSSCSIRGPLNYSSWVWLRDHSLGMQ